MGNRKDERRSHMPQYPSNRTQTDTQIRNFYSDGMSYMNIRFYNMNLSFHLNPFMGKDNNGRSQYNMQNGAQTTVNFEGAFTLWKAGTDILEGKLQEVTVVIPCYGDASIKLERKGTGPNMYDTIFSITKAGNTVPFKFSVTPYQVKENGTMITKYLDSGLGAFVKTIEGYLTGINADRHLNKLTDDFVKIQNQKQQEGAPAQSNAPQQNPNYSQNNNRGNWNRNNRYRNNRYNNYQNNSNNGWNQNAQNMSNYSLQ